MLFDWIVANSDKIMFSALCTIGWCTILVILHLIIDRVFRISERIELEKETNEYLKLLVKLKTEERKKL